MDRRHFLRSALGAAAGVALPGCNFELRPGELPAPAASAIEHVVVTMMENRSFDHIFGWLPNADGKQAGLSYTDIAGVLHATFPLAPDYKICGGGPDQSYDSARSQYNSGAMDGFLRAGNLKSLGYYVESDLPFFGALARNFTVLDRYFCSMAGPTNPNRMFLHAAATDRIAGSFDHSSLPTIWDRLADARVSRRYYVQNFTSLGPWGQKYDAITATLSDFLNDCGRGQLPAVSMVEPLGSINDDHPPADVRAGDAFLSLMYGTLTSAPTWKSTVWVITFDEWGGFFDHVPPPRAAAANVADTDVINGKALLGFRVPVVIVSPFSRGRPARNRVDSRIYDHTSILKLIEWRWELQPLSARDASDDVENLALALNFGGYDPSEPALPVVIDPGSPGCP